MSQITKLDSLVWLTTKGRGHIPAFFGQSQFHIAGIVNITPDSFSDGGNFFETDKAIAHAIKLVEEGADSIDFGAESTRPGSSPLDAEEEQKRLLPVLEGFQAALEDKGLETVVAIDTYHASTAAVVLEKKLATVINDISGGVLEPAMLEVIAQYSPGYVIGHCPYPPAVMQEHIHYDNVVEDLLRYFEERLSVLVKAGINEQTLVVDPCIGFAKTREHNLSLIQNASSFLSLGRPLYYGISRKSFLQGYATPSIIDKDIATQLVTAYLAQRGIGIHRVHNVSAARRTLLLTAALNS